MRTTPWELSKEDIGWLSGIIDGEGSIHIKHYEQYPHFRYGLYLINTNEELLEKCKRIITAIDDVDHGRGLAIYKKNYKVGLGKKQCYQLQIRRIGTLISILKTTLPHLTEKRERATELLSELSNHKKNARWKIERQARRD